MIYNAQVSSSDWRRHAALIPCRADSIDQFTAQQHTSYIIPDKEFPQFRRCRSQQASSEYVSTAFVSRFCCCSVSQLYSFCREYDLMSVEPLFTFNMPELTKLLKSQAEQNPSASYFNVDILKVTSKCFSIDMS